MYFKITIKKEITKKAYEAALQYLAFYRGTIYVENPNTDDTENRTFYFAEFIYRGNTTNEELKEYTMITIIKIVKDFGFELNEGDYEIEDRDDNLFDPFGMYTFWISQIHMYYTPPKLGKKIKWVQMQQHYMTFFEAVLGSRAIESFKTKTHLSKVQTELPMNIFIDDCKLYQKMGISKRIYFQLNKNDEFQMDAICPIRLKGTIPKQHFETYCTTSYPEFNLNESDLEQLKNFVLKNKELLEKVADQEITFEEFKTILGL